MLFRRLTAWSIIASLTAANLTFANPEIFEGVGSVAPATAPGPLTLVGNVPGKYVGRGAEHVLATVTMNGDKITEVKAITDAQAAALAGKPGVIVLKRKGQAQYDTVYPGLFNLHNHTKQNVVPVWGDAKGQFGNRFEWRGWSNYKNSVSGNMNPWVGYGAPITCAAFRWSEMLNMTLGATHLQGPSSCVSNWGIHHVEADYGIGAPTDLIYPNEMTFVWNTVRPKMLALAGLQPTDDFNKAIAAGKTYEEGLKAVIHEYCPALAPKIQNVNGASELKILSDKKQLEAGCDAAKIKDPKFIRYTYFIHKGIAGKKNKVTPLITHLAEGRRNDPYNKLEFQLLRLLGLDRPGVNLVHAVGVDAAGFAHMGAKKMGLIWSPFSNLLLYGETADILAAHKAGVKISIGSDWTPTGSKSVLEEMKVAREYVKKHKIDGVFTDEYLVNMMTENAAAMLNIKAGAIRAGLESSLIVVSNKEKNPYTNLLLSDSRDVNLVIVDGNPIYGNESYIVAANAAMGVKRGYEDLSAALDFSSLTPGSMPKAVAAAPGEKATPAEKLAHLLTVAKAVAGAKILPGKDECGFSEKKVYVFQNSSGAAAGVSTAGADEDEEEGEDSAPGASMSVADFAARTGVNLERGMDIYKLLAANLLTQSRNVYGSETEKKFAVTTFPALYSCNDASYTARLMGFVKSTASTDEESANIAGRPAWRAKLSGNGLKATEMQKQAKAYGLTYDPKRDY